LHLAGRFPVLRFGAKVYNARIARFDIFFAAARVFLGCRLFNKYLAAEFALHRIVRYLRSAFFTKHNFTSSTLIPFPSAQPPFSENTHYYSIYYIPIRVSSQYLHDYNIKTFMLFLSAYLSVFQYCTL